MKKYGLILAAVFAVVLIGGCFGEKEDFAALMTKAEKSASDGKWEEALEYSQDAVKCQPKNAEAIVLTALAYENLGKTNEALEEITKASALAPQAFFVQYTHGRMLFERARFESCIAPLKNALKLRPGNRDTLVLLARVSVIQKNMQEAKYYNALLTKDPVLAKKAAPWSEYGMVVLLDDRKPKASLAYFNYAYRLEPSNPVTVLNMAVLYDRYLKNPRYAKAFYQKYLQLTQMDSSLAQERAAVEKRIKAL